MSELPTSTRTATTITQEEEEEEEEQQLQAEQEEAGVFVKSSNGRVMQCAIKVRYQGELQFLDVLNSL